MVYEDAVVLAFLYNRPLFPEHVLLVPREPVETLAARMLGRSTIG